MLWNEIHTGKFFFHSFRSATSPKCSSPEWPGGRKTLKDWRSCRWKGGSLNTVFLCFFFFFSTAVDGGM